jgi:hypothetical protein
MLRKIDLSLGKVNLSHRCHGAPLPLWEMVAMRLWQVQPVSVTLNQEDEPLEGLVRSGHSKSGGGPAGPGARVLRMGLLAARTDIPSEILAKAQTLDLYYIPARYPNGLASGKPADYFNRDKAKEALDAAGGIQRFCESLLS